MTLVLGADDVAQLVPQVDAVALVEAVHADLGAGRMVQPAPVSLGGADDAVFLPMAVRSDRLGLVAVKLLADVPGNPARGLPGQRSTILLTSAPSHGCTSARSALRVIMCMPGM